MKLRIHDIHWLVAIAIAAAPFVVFCSQVLAACVANILN